MASTSTGEEGKEQEASASRLSGSCDGAERDDDGCEAAALQRGGDDGEARMGVAGGPDSTWQLAASGPYGSVLTEREFLGAFGIRVEAAYQERSDVD